MTPAISPFFVCYTPAWSVTQRGWRARLLSLLLAAGCCFSVGQAQTTVASNLKRLSVEELLQQEVVSVSRRPERWGATAGNVFLMTGKTVRQTGATVLPEVLRLAPNLFVAQASAYNWGISARGFLRTNGASNKLLVLIDGRTAYSPLFSNVFWDATDVFLPDLAGVEVISGPSGANWGANAVNGVINVRTKTAFETLGGLLQTSAGPGGNQVAVRQGWRFGREGAIRVYAKSTEREATLGPAGETDDSDSWHTLQAGFRADWGNATEGEFTVQGEGLAGRYHSRPLDDIKNGSANLIMRWARTLSAQSEVWVRAYYDYVKRDTSGFLTEKTHTGDVEFQYRYDFTNGQRLLGGANYRLIADKADDSVGFAILPKSLKYDLGSAFVQHEAFFAHNRLRLTSGLRMEHNYFSGWETQPSVRLAWYDQQRHTVWISASRATRIPSRLDTGFHAPETPPYVVIGGPDFTSEILRAYELGWREQMAKNLALMVTLYYHDYSRLRSVEPTTPVVEANGVEGRSVGAEWFVDWDVTPVWRLRFGGFVNRQETWLAPGGADLEQGRGESSYPDYQAQLRSTFRLTPKVDLWLALRRVGAVVATENGGGEVPAYTELDAHLGWEVRPGLSLGLTGRNLLSPSHPELGGLTKRREIPRRLEATLGWQF